MEEDEERRQGETFTIKLTTRQDISLEFVVLNEHNLRKFNFTKMLFDVVVVEMGGNFSCSENAN